ncbi:MAG: nucleoside triphosphate pyrophosphatase [Woeseiaceae bacterium]
MKRSDLTREQRSTPSIILASQSAGRKALLARICNDFSCQPANIDESALDGESPRSLAQRLAREKAEAIHRSGGQIVIGSDQVAICQDRRLSKPGTAKATQAQLAFCSGQIVTFFTAVNLWHQDRNEHYAHIDETQVVFRLLNEPEIERYVTLDEPWDCAGGFRLESRGMTLFERVESTDPSALIGMPLIFVAAALRKFGWTL